MCIRDRSYNVQASPLLDSLLTELSTLADENGPEALREKSIICQEISDQYNLKYGDQDYSRTYLLQAKVFLENAIEATAKTRSDDLLRLIELNRVLMLVELASSNLEASNTYMLAYESLVEKIAGKVSNKAYNRLQYEYHHTLFCRNFNLGNYE